MKRLVKLRENRSEKPARQRGAVLVFALLLLLVMTVLGVASIGNSVLEERMSGNFYQSTSALQSAEIGLRVAENWLRGFETGWSGISKANLVDDGWFNGGKTGLYSTQAEPGIYATCQNIDGDHIEGCGFQPTDESHWCTDCDELPKGYVTLGTDDLVTGTLPAIDQEMVSQQPRFIIEYIGRSGELVGNLTMGAQQQPDLRKYAFRITAIGWGRDPNARHVLQSHFLVPL